ncbi:MAG: H-NS histone family protein [Pseudomonadota bacterium]
MDLSNMSSAELRDLQEKVKRELKQRESQDLAKAREQIMAIAQSVGVPLKDLVGGAGTGTRAKTGSVAPRYRNPADASQQWTGRGRQPKWVKEWLEAGKDIAGLKV